MQHYIECKVRYQKTMEDGTEKIVNEPYLVDALSFTEAESRITDEMSVYISGEFRVDAVKKCNAYEVLFSDVDDDDKWYKAKLQFITIDEKTEKEKRSNTTYLVQAKSLARALRYVDEFMGKTMIDYDIVGLNETKIMDVFKYEPKTKEDEDGTQGINLRVMDALSLLSKSFCDDLIHVGVVLVQQIHHQHSTDGIRAHIGIWVIGHLLLELSVYREP
jgi:hypothetical protein